MGSRPVRRPSWRSGRSPVGANIAIYDITFRHGTLVLMATSPYDPRHEELVHRISEERKAQGITQEAMAEHLGLPQSVISRLESGQRKVSAIELRDLADLLGVTMEDLVPPRG